MVPWRAELSALTGATADFNIRFLLQLVSHSSEPPRAHVRHCLAPHCRIRALQSPLKGKHFLAATIFALRRIILLVQLRLQDLSHEFLFNPFLLLFLVFFVFARTLVLEQVASDLTCL